MNHRSVKLKVKNPKLIKTVLHQCHVGIPISQIPFSVIPHLNWSIEPTLFKSWGKLFLKQAAAITKASFQVISIWLGQRKFSFKNSYLITIDMALSEKTLEIVWLEGGWSLVSSFIVLYIIKLSVFYDEETASPT